jgi:hypothetical protein
MIQEKIVDKLLDLLRISEIIEIDQDGKVHYDSETEQLRKEIIEMITKELHLGAIRYHCYLCEKSVTSELPGDSVIRAILICPECIEADKIKF